MFNERKPWEPLHHDRTKDSDESLAGALVIGGLVAVVVGIASWFMLGRAVLDALSRLLH